MKKKNRKLKIYSKFSHKVYKKYIQVPEIILRGKWLRKIGFTEGKQIVVEESQKQIIIRLIDNETNVTKS